MILALACTSLTVSSPTPGGTVPADESIPGETGTDDDACVDPPDVRVNEVVASNVQGITDEDGDAADWVEVHNRAGISLSGWTVAGLPLAEGSFVVTFATIAAEGESVELHMPDGCVADSLDTGRLYADIAYGRTEAGTWEYFLEPTPGAANTTESRPGFADPPALSPAAGFYDGASTITLSGGGTLHYTLDGSVPDADDPAYTEPFTLPDDVEMSVVRAVSVVDGLWPSRVATGSYSAYPSLLDDGLMVISLVAEPAELFDEETGIYTYGPDYEPYYPYFGANFWELWERDVHVEVFSADGATQLSQDAGIQIAGGYSRAFDQRNFELLARAGYGPETFAAKLFPEEELDHFERLYLRNGGDWCSTQIIDATVQALFRTDDGARHEAVDAQAYAPALVYINGAFWGLYELKERLDEFWIAGHHGEDPEDLDRVKVGWTHEANWELESGDWEAFTALDAFATRDLSDPAVYTEFTSLVDVENFASAAVAQGWIGNGDWWWNNIRMWRPRRDDGRWRWMVYDFGHGWGDYRYDHLATSVSGNWSGLPLGAALANEDFRNLFVNVHADFLNTTLAGAAAEAVVTRLGDEVRPAMKKQRQRWCSGGMSTFESAITWAEEYARNRAAAVDGALVANLGLSGHVALQVDADPPRSGSFHLAVATVVPPWSGVYYEGVPVTITALPAEGYRFVEWADGSTEATRVLPMAASTTAVARFEN